jgi:hypothetical protein
MGPLSAAESSNSIDSVCIVSVCYSKFKDETTALKYNFPPLIYKHHPEQNECVIPRTLLTPASHNPDNPLSLVYVLQPLLLQQDSVTRVRQLLQATAAKGQ